MSYDIQGNEFNQLEKKSPSTTKIKSNIYKTTASY